MRAGRFVVLVTFALLPAVAAAVWFANWRERLSRISLVEAQKRQATILDDLDTLRISYETWLVRPSSASAAESLAVSLAGSMVTALTAAEQLDDIQEVLTDSLDRIRVLVDEEASRDSLAGEMWVWGNLARGKTREVFVSGERATSTLEAAAALRSKILSADLGPDRIRDLVLQFPIGNSSGQASIRASLLWETGLQLGLRPGGERDALRLLREAQAEYTEEFNFGDDDNQSPEDWQRRYRRYPDPGLPGDIADILARVTASMADTVWLRIQAPTEDYAQLTDGQLEVAFMESHLRWLLCRFHLRNGDANWFRLRRDTLERGPLLYHHWSRLLAGEAAGLALEGPSYEDIDDIPEDAREILDRVVLAEAVGSPESLTALRSDLGATISGLEPSFAFLQSDRAFLPVARAIAIAFPKEEMIFSQLRDLAPPIPSTLTPMTRWTATQTLRLHAARAIGTVRMLRGGRGPIIERVPADLAFRSGSCWFLDAGPTKQEETTFDRYVPGLLSVYHVIRVATLPLVRTQKSALVSERASPGGTVWIFV